MPQTAIAARTAHRDGTLRVANSAAEPDDDSTPPEARAI